MYHATLEGLEIHKQVYYVGGKHTNIKHGKRFFNKTNYEIALTECSTSQSISPNLTKLQKLSKQPQNNAAVARSKGMGTNGQ